MANKAVGIGQHLEAVVKQRNRAAEVEGTCLFVSFSSV